MLVMLGLCGAHGLCNLIIEKKCNLALFTHNEQTHFHSINHVFGLTFLSLNGPPDTKKGKTYLK